jgi:putative ABC transport system permease protein
MTTLQRDLRLALRSLAQKPGFATVIILTLGLGTGAATAIFSVVHAVIFQPLPFREPEYSKVFRTGCAFALSSAVSLN